MSVYVSHSFSNDDDFDNVANALKGQGVAFWDPGTIKGGGSLRAQLREAVSQCDVCIFIATRDSVNSSWCGAELGAFWGAGKPILVFLADPSLQDNELPQIVRGDVWLRKLTAIAEQSRDFVKARADLSGSAGLDKQVVPSRFSAEQAEKLLTSAVSLAATTVKDKVPESAIDQIGDALQGVVGKVLTGLRATGSISEAAQATRKSGLWVARDIASRSFEREALESMGLTFKMVQSIDESFELIRREDFSLVVSTLDPNTEPSQPFHLLRTLTALPRKMPFILYNENAGLFRQEAGLLGAHGATADPQELFGLVVSAITRR